MSVRSLAGALLVVAVGGLAAGCSEPMGVATFEGLVVTTSQDTVRLVEDSVGISVRDRGATGQSLAGGALTFSTEGDTALTVFTADSAAWVYYPSGETYELTTRRSVPTSRCRRWRRYGWRTAVSSPLNSH